MSDTAQILTTQNVAINYTTANIGERLLARLLDLAFFAAYLFVFYLIAGAVFSKAGGHEMGKLMNAVWLIIPIPVLTYTLWVEPIFNGRSFGKLIMGLKVVKVNGMPAGMGDFAFRWISRILEGEFAAFTCLALPVAIVSKKSQRIGDMIAGTIVIRVKHRSSLRNTILSHINPNYRIVFPQVSALSDSDMNIIRDVMTQAFETGNYQLLEYLGQKVKSVMKVNPNPQQLPTVQFLNIVLADYAHYSFAGV